MTQTTLDSINQNVKMLFVTDEHERVINTAFGSRFRNILFENDSPNIRKKIIDESNRLFNTFLPNLQLDKLDFQVVADTDLVQNILKMRIQYSIKQLSGVKDSISLIIG